MPEVASRSDFENAKDTTCPECGEEISSSANFCGWCGLELDSFEE